MDLCYIYKKPIEIIITLIVVAIIAPMAIQQVEVTNTCTDLSYNSLVNQNIIAVLGVLLIINITGFILFIYPGYIVKDEKKE